METQKKIEGQRPPRGPKMRRTRVDLTLCIVVVGIILIGNICAVAAASDWQRISVGGGSMKWDLFDVDGDGFNDSLTVANWYKNPGNNYSSWQRFSTGWTEEIWNDGYQVGHENISSFFGGHHRVGDVDGDALPDIVIGTLGWEGPHIPPNMRNSVFAAVNPGDYGNWSFFYIGALPGTEDGVEAVAIGDMNNDGYPDIVAGGECHEVRLYKNPGYMTNNWSYNILHTFNTTVYYNYTNGWSSSQAQDVEGMVINDFNRDGLLDVAVITANFAAGAGGTYILLNPGQVCNDWPLVTVGDTGNPEFIHVFSSCMETLDSGDIDGDGLSDMVVVNRNGAIPYLWWAKNIDGFSWSTATLIDNLFDIPLSGYPPLVVDINQDGFADIITYNQLRGGTFWYKNPGVGNGVWNHTRICANGLSYCGVGDVDNDGDPDIIASGYWYVNPNKEGLPCGCTVNNTLQRYQDDICIDSFVCNESICDADTMCNNKLRETVCAIGKRCNETCKCVFVPPTVVAFQPAQNIFNFQNTTRKFNVTLDQPANVTWQINGTTVQTNITVSNAAYTNTSALNGVWNVSAIISTAHGNSIHTWNWQVATHCFIATAAYGTPLHDDIDVLRRVRDNYLLPNRAGEFIVKSYYAISPPIAGLISNNEALKYITRVFIVQPMVEIFK